MVKQKFIVPISVFIAVSILLALVQVKVDNPMILLERFFRGGGWIEIPLIALYGAIVSYNMQDPAKQALWRIRTWSIFSWVFFIQLFIGLSGADIFLMTGELHLPLPALIVAGPVYRAEIGFMTILFLTTVVISGPAWCSQLCYFGAIDGYFSSKKKATRSIKYKSLPYKLSGLLIIITVSLALRLLKVDPKIATGIALVFAAVAIAIIAFASRKSGKMVHCLSYCPVGTVVNYTRFINPFRFRIANSCTNCMKCIPVCRYDALSTERISLKSPGITCTLCGDCISSCKPGAFYYKFPGLSPVASRNLYIGVTITLHAVFIALARI